MEPSGSGRPFEQTAPLTPGDVQSVVFTTTRMRLGYDVEEVDAFLDRVVWSMEKLTSQVNNLTERTEKAEAAQSAIRFEVRSVLEDALARLGGPTGGAGRTVYEQPTSGWQPPAGPALSGIPAPPKANALPAGPPGQPPAAPPMPGPTQGPPPGQGYPGQPGPPQGGPMPTTRPAMPQPPSGAGFQPPPGYPAGPPR